MKKISIFVAAGLCLIVYLAYGHDQKQPNRYVNRYKLSTGLIAVVAEGDFEPRSIGSYSLRVYKVYDAKFPCDDFLCGTIRYRDGSIENVKIQDINGDGTTEIVIIIRCAGTGGYISADAFNYKEEKLRLCANVSGLKKNADPINELKKIFKKTEQKNPPDKK